MNYAAVSIAVLPLRPQPDERSEMLTQILFGELVEILDTTGNWALIKNIYDNYKGWVDSRNLIHISNDEFSRLCASEQYIVPELFLEASDEFSDNIFIPAGGCLPDYDKKNGSFTLGSRLYKLKSPAKPVYPTVRETICNTALKFINSPYLWGGKNFLGIDCSGLTQICYRIAGIPIPRDAGVQAKAGKPVSFLSNSKPGSLAFFDNNEGVITHTGILLSPETIIHSSGKVRTDRIDHQGIYNEEIRKYTHKLRVIVDYIDD